jgi:hypothetical protein
MIVMKKSQLLLSLLATAALLLAPSLVPASTAGDVSVLQVLNTSPLWADSSSYHACTVANVSTATVEVYVELINNAGVAIGTSGTTATAIAAGSIYELQPSVAYSGFARCRITTNAPQAVIRANLAVFYQLPSTSSFQTFAISEAR